MSKSKPPNGEPITSTKDDKGFPRQRHINRDPDGPTPDEWSTMYGHSDLLGDNPP